jgi:hypothetical protein
VKIVLGFVRTLYRIAGVGVVLWLLLLVAGDPDGTVKVIEGWLDRTGSIVRHWLGLPG